MAKHAPGKHYRIGISLVDAVKRFSDEAEAERLFVEAAGRTACAAWNAARRTSSRALRASPRPSGATIAASTSP